MTVAEDDRRLIERLAQQHHLSVGAVEELFVAIQRGHGTSAQFNHPDLGGMGQWMPGGMLMIGDFSNHRLKATVADLCTTISAYLAQRPAQPVAPSGMQWASASGWWPGELGQPSATGSQNAMHYAYFPAQRRLAVRVGSRVTLYETLDHQITGVGQQQALGQSLVFRSQHGDVDLARLPRVGEYEL